MKAYLPYKAVRNCNLMSQKKSRMSKNQTFHIVHAGMPKTASKTLTACLGKKKF